MIYSVSIYSKTGKLRETVSSKNMTKRHWELFRKEERDRKHFVKNSVTKDCYKLLTNYRNINFMCDSLHKNEQWKTI